MATFSVNQVRQLYVAKELKSPNVISTDAAGAIAVKNDTAKTHLYFEYMGAGGITRSDLIPTGNITYAKAVDADDMAYELKRYKLILDPSVNSGAVAAGQDYLLRITFRNYIGLSEEHQTVKYGMVHGYTGMTASDFYKTLALSLVKNFSREVSQLLKFYLETGGTAAGTVGTVAEVTNDTKPSTLTGTYTGIVIEEAPQEWTLGLFEQQTVDFTLQPDSIVVAGDEVIWGVVTSVTSVNKIENGKKVADMEYFYMGERGDQYRMAGWPNIVKTTYLVDPTIKYNVIELHYSYIGDNEAVQKSEKDITIVVPKVGEENNTSNVLANSIITAINSATGLTIKALDVSGGE